MACITVNEDYVCGVFNQLKEVLFDPEPREINELTPVIKDVNITGIMGRNVQGIGIYMYGLPEMPIENVTISNVNFDIIGPQKEFYAVMAFSREPSWGDGVFMENAEKMNHLNINCVSEKITLKNCENIFLNEVQIA